MTNTGPRQQATLVSICIGCGCKDRTNCESAWLAQADGLGVCSRCRHALPAWDAGSRLAGRVPLAAITTQRLLVRLGGRLLEPFMGSDPLPVGNYYLLTTKRTVIVVDQDGSPAIPKKGARLEIGQGKFPLSVEREIKRRQRVAKKRSRRSRA